VASTNFSICFTLWCRLSCGAEILRHWPWHRHIYCVATSGHQPNGPSIPKVAAAGIFFSIGSRQALSRRCWFLLSFDSAWEVSNRGRHQPSAPLPCITERARSRLVPIVGLFPVRPEPAQHSALPRDLVRLYSMAAASGQYSIASCFSCPYGRLAATVVACASLQAQRGDYMWRFEVEKMSRSHLFPYMGRFVINSFI
jgi:hypothetical protein